jgi:hypothetical protein
MKLCPKCGKRFTDDANFCPVDAARLTPLEGDAALAASASSGAIDALAARFELRERLGGDRTGTVCRAVDKQTQALVAVKIIASPLTASSNVSQRMERELKQLERLQHAGIAKVIASGKRGDQAWLATELVDGARPLFEVVRSHGPLNPLMAAELVEHIGEALIEAAQVGVVHHDLSPKNVLLAGSDLKLINFSVAVPGTDATPGVPEFVSPEQVEGKAADQRSNIYSLGALFYFALTGRPPFQGDITEVHAQHASGSIVPPSQLVPISPPELEQVIMRSLERAPSKRYLTVRQFVDEVARVSHSGGENLRTTHPLGRAGKPKAELVQTLLGMPGDQLRAAAAALKAKEAVLAKPVQVGMPEIVPPVASASVAAAPVTVAPAAPVAPVVSPEVAAAPTQATPVLAAADRSPWAPLEGPPSMPAPVVATSPAAPAAAPAGSAAATAAAASLAAPKVGSTAGANPNASSRRRRSEGGGKSKGKFRETMWFKKGELDAAAAEAAAAERARTGKEVDRDKADSLPMDERYKDDGSLSNTDQHRYSLKTGGTNMMPTIRDASADGSGEVSENELINEMKAGRVKYVIAILLALAFVGALVVLVAR